MASDCGQLDCGQLDCGLMDSRVPVEGAEPLEEPVRKVVCMSRFFSDCKCVNLTFGVHRLNS